MIVRNKHHEHQRLYDLKKEFYDRCKNRIYIWEPVLELQCPLIPSTRHQSGPALMGSSRVRFGFESPPLLCLPQITAVPKAVLGLDKTNPLVRSKEPGNRLKVLWTYRINIIRHAAKFSHMYIRDRLDHFLFSPLFTIALDKILTRMFTWYINLQQVKTHM